MRGQFLGTPLKVNNLLLFICSATLSLTIVLPALSASLIDCTAVEVTTLEEVVAVWTRSAMMCFKYESLRTHGQMQTE